MATSSRQTGYDCEFVTAPPKSLECPICLLTVRQPHVITCCGNQFCQACIGRIQQDKKPCPLCNEVKFTTFLHKGVMREVNSLMVYCPNKKDGCDWKGELGQLEEHLNPSVSKPGKGCGYVLVKCHYECGEMVLRKHVQDHEWICSKQSMEMQVNTLSKKLEDLSGKLDNVLFDNKKLKAELNELKLENSKRKMEYKELNEKYETLKASNHGYQLQSPSYNSSLLQAKEPRSNYGRMGGASLTPIDDIPVVKTLCATQGCSFKGYHDLNNLCPDCYEEQHQTKVLQEKYPLV